MELKRCQLAHSMVGCAPFPNTPVYPRVGGGTFLQMGGLERRTGLSPRVRGNRPRAG